MTRHKEIRLDTRGQIMHHLRFIEATGESYDRVKQAIRAHLMRDHRLEPERLGFGYQEFLHMAACIRLPSNYSLDDAFLPRILGLPKIVYPRGLPPRIEEG